MLQRDVTPRCPVCPPAAQKSAEKNGKRFIRFIICFAVCHANSDVLICPKRAPRQAALREGR